VTTPKKVLACRPTGQCLGSPTRSRNVLMDYSVQDNRTCHAPYRDHRKKPQGCTGYRHSRLFVCRLLYFAPAVTDRIQQAVKCLSLSKVNEGLSQTTSDWTECLGDWRESCQRVRSCDSFTWSYSIAGLILQSLQP